MAQFDPLSWTGGYIPVGPSLEAFFLSPAAARAVVGPDSGGRKTVAAHYIRRLAGVVAEKGDQRHWRWLVVAPRHADDTAIAAWQKWTSGTHGSIGEWSKTGIPTHTVEYQGMPGRPVIEMLFLDWGNATHRDRLGSGNCSGVWLDKAADLPEEALDAALGAVSRYWPGPLQRRGHMRPRVLVTSRMPLAEHWLPRRFRPGSADMPLFRQPGGRTAEAEDRHLRAARPNFYRDLAKSMPAEWVRVHVDAEWGGQSGTPEEILAQEAMRKAARERLYTYYPDEGPLRRELYAKQVELFAAGAVHQERANIGSNRSGKSFALAYETACHMTNWYPHWWAGRRFDRPVTAWIAGEDAKAVRESMQVHLMGSPEALGTGLIPGDMLVGKSSARGVADAIDFFEVRCPRGISRGLLKAYEQGRKSFQAAQIDIGNCDEEPPFDIYTEFLTRTMSTNPAEPNGIMSCAFTPLKGVGPTVLHYLPGGKMPATEELRKIAWGW